MGDEVSLKALLHREGLWADKRLGQHFLLDLGITRRIAGLAGPIQGKPVLEIGPGPGGLTLALLEAGADPVIAIERDPRFFPILADHGARFPGRLHVIEADALAVDEAALLQRYAEGRGPAVIAANLPYNVATPLLVKWLKAPTMWRGPMALMFQKEVAQRITAAPGSTHYGRLAVLAQAVCRARIGLTLPAGAFTPPPKVASAVATLETLEAPFADLEGLEAVTAAAFGQRRKMLRSALATFAGGTGGAEVLLARAAITATVRAEDCKVADFIRLTQAWRGTA
jgi:16S rRNA (adenine1518-N6/adenine1519-N6)-dimethyltransferase